MKKGLVIGLILLAIVFLTTTQTSKLNLASTVISPMNEQNPGI